VARQVFSSHPEGPFGWTRADLALIELLRRLRRRWLHPVEVLQESGSWYREARAMRAHAREVRTEVPDPAVMLDDFAHHFTSLLRRAQAHARRVLVLRQPWFEKDYTPDELAHMWHGGNGKAWRERPTAYYAMSVLCRLMALMDARAVAVADALGVEHVNLRPAVPDTLRNYFDFVHYTPAGSALVAAAVAGALLQPVYEMRNAECGVRNERLPR
jgi:hypothetical protein